MSIKELKKEYKNNLKTEREAFRNKKRGIKKSFKDRLEEGYVSGEIERPKDPPKRSLLEEIGNAVTHGVGSLFAIVALVLMLISSNGVLEYIGASIYFFGLFVMFTASCLYHAFAHGSAVKRLFRRFDYSSIYLLIGATFAPILLSVVGGFFGNLFFIIQWALIITGISLVGVFGPTKLRFIHIPMYVILGWSALMLFPFMLEFSMPFTMWILAGGVLYTLGIIPFCMKLRASHFIWHFFVLAGALTQWIGIYVYVYI